MLELVRDYWQVFLLYAPLGVVGAWRWSVWMIEKIIALFYEPIPERPGYCPTLTIITPVYNEEPEVFQASLDSWLLNDPDEIIAVIDYTDEVNIELFTKFQKSHPTARLIIERVPGKRAALHDGILQASGEIIALVDDDTTWDANIRGELVAPFFDPRVGAVAPRQMASSTDTLARRLFAIHLALRHDIELPFLSTVGHALRCISGRTALYRGDLLREVVEELTHEQFLGTTCISGEDKCLTRLTETRGWNIAYQSEAIVRTPGMAGLRNYLKQNIRWARNSWRSDIRIVFSAWAWKRERGLAFYLIDKFLVIFVVWLGPVYFFTTIYLSHFRATVILLVWWFVSRAVKLFPHLRKNLRDIVLLPLYVLESYVGSFLKLYALFTMRRQGWITRWSANRLQKIRHVFLNDLLAYAAVCAVIAGVAWGSLSYGVRVYYGYVSVRAETSVTVDVSDDEQTLGFPPQRKIVAYRDGYAMTYRKKVDGVYQPFVAFVRQVSEDLVQMTGTREPAVKLPLTQRVASLVTNEEGGLGAVFYGAVSGETEENRQISYTAYDERLGKWAEPKSLSFVPGFNGQDEWQEHPYLTSGGKGVLYAAWEGKDEHHKKPQIKFSRSLDGGQTWAPWINVRPKSSEAQSRPLLLVSGDGVLHLFFYLTASGRPAVIAHSESRDAGITWSSFRILSDSVFDARHLSGVIDAHDTIYLAYRSAAAVKSPAQIQLVIRSGEEWSKPRIIRESDLEQLYPSLALMEDGRILVAWTENRQPLGYPERASFDEVRLGIYEPDSKIFSLAEMAFRGSFATLAEYSSGTIPLVYSVTTPTSTAVMLRLISL